MGLLQNRFRHSLTGKFFGATAISGCVPSLLIGAFPKPCHRRNAFVGGAITDKTASVPNGNRPPVAWVMAQKNGGMSSRINDFVLSAIANGVMGVPISGAASVAVVTNTPYGMLVAFGDGAALIEVLVNTPSLTSIAPAGGACSLSVVSNAPLLGAVASVFGNSSITVTVSDVTAFPLDDSSPLRAGSTSFSVTGALTPYAIGQLSGSTVDSVVLTADSITAAVWNAILADCCRDRIRRQHAAINR